MKFVFALVAVVAVVGFAGCSEESSGGGGTVVIDDTRSHEKEHRGGHRGQSVYALVAEPEDNQGNLVNLTVGENHADFLYSPSEDQLISLTRFKLGPLIGCEQSDIVPQVLLSKANMRGEFDTASNKSLGPMQLVLESQQKYIVRLSLKLKKECLGLAFGFRVHTEPLPADRE